MSGLSFRTLKHQRAQNQKLSSLWRGAPHWHIVSNFSVRGYFTSSFYKHSSVCVVSHTSLQPCDSRTCNPVSLCIMSERNVQTAFDTSHPLPPFIYPCFPSGFLSPSHSPSFTNTHTFLFLMWWHYCLKGARCRNVSNSTLTNCGRAVMIAIMPACPNLDTSKWKQKGDWEKLGSVRALLFLRVLKKNWTEIRLFLFFRTVTTSGYF